MAMEVESVEAWAGGWNHQHGYSDLKVVGYFTDGIIQKFDRIMGKRNSANADFKVKSSEYQIRGATLWGIGWECLATHKRYLCFKVGKNDVTVVHDVKS